MSSNEFYLLWALLAVALIAVTSTILLLRENKWRRVVQKEFESALQSCDATLTNCLRQLEQERAMRRELEASGTLSLARYRAALLKIRDEFDKLNGIECDRGCGRCIRCIARTVLAESPAEKVTFYNEENTAALLNAGLKGRLVLLSND